MTVAEALVIGGGIAGAATAAHLARENRAVVLVERKAHSHDKVCGEFISAEATLYLRDLGIDFEALGAVRISDVRLYTPNKVFRLPLPFPAFSVSRRSLDECMLGAASNSGAELRRGHAVRSLQRDEGRWIAELDNGDSLSAAEVFLATGKHDLRGWRRPAGKQVDLVAFKMHWRLRDTQTDLLDSRVELFLLPGGYAGLELVENRIANLCLVIRRRRLAELGGQWQLLLAALRSQFQPLDERLAGACACWDRPLAIAAIPYGHMQIAGDGPWRVGDQAAVIPSFAGDGIAIALHSARLASRFYLAGAGATEFQPRLASDLEVQIREATIISRLLVHPVTLPIAEFALQFIPHVASAIARRTRIPHRQLMLTREPLAERKI